MTEHTPGPWEWYWRVNDDNLEADCGVLSDVKSGRARSICRCPRFEAEDQWRANARLIAAAPDLLAALKKIEEHWGGTPEDLMLPPLSLMFDVRQAIAKADGRDV